MKEKKGDVYELNRRWRRKMVADNGCLGGAKRVLVRGENDGAKGWFSDGSCELMKKVTWG